MWTRGGRGWRSEFRVLMTVAAFTTESFDAYGAKQKSEPNTMLESTNYNTVPTAAYTEDVSMQMAKTL